VERVVRQAVLSWFCVDAKLCDEALCQGTSVLVLISNQLVDDRCARGRAEGMSQTSPLHLVHWKNGSSSEQELCYVLYRICVNVKCCDEAV
jgi:hypothetical protein